MIKLLLCIIAFFLNFLLSQCCVMNHCGDLPTEKAQVSKDGRIKLELGVGDSAIILKVTNISSETLAVATGDIEGGFCYSIAMFDHERKAISCADCCADRTFDPTKVNFGKAFIELEPGKSVCKIYRENERIYEYQIVWSFEGRIFITRHSYRMPPIKDISRVSVYYDTDWIMWKLACIANQEVPNNAFRGKADISWDREPQEQK